MSSSRDPAGDFVLGVVMGVPVSSMFEDDLVANRL